MPLLDFSASHVTVTGGAGFLGSFVCQELKRRGVSDDRLTAPRRTSRDLRRFDVCLEATRGRDLVIHLAANVGGIGYNQAHPGELFHDNMLLGLNITEACRLNGVKKLVLVGTVCGYPKFTPPPFKETDLWNGFPEETNAPYGVAKRALLMMAQAYRRQYGMDAIYLIPVNLYGPRDEFAPERSHVIPALIRKFVEARDRGLPQVTVWGTGAATREFLYVKDAARAIVLAAERYDDPEPVNLGAGRDISIKDLAGSIAELTGYRGSIAWDASKPDGQPKRLLDVTRAKERFGFEAGMDFRQGLAETIRWFEAQKAAAV